MDGAAWRLRRGPDPSATHPGGAAAVGGASTGLHSAGQQSVGFVVTPDAAAGAWHVERLPEAAVHRHDQALSSAPSVHWRDAGPQRSSYSARSFTTLIEMLHDAASSGTAGPAGTAGTPAGAEGTGTSCAGAGAAGIAGAKGAAGAGATVPVSASGVEESGPPQAGTRTRASATPRSVGFMRRRRGDRASLTRPSSGAAPWQLCQSTTSHPANRGGPTIVPAVERPWR
jgi:hypothetical protein